MSRDVPLSTIGTPDTIRAAPYGPDNDGDNSPPSDDATTAVAIDPQREGLLEGYSSGDGRVDQETPTRGPSSFDDQPLPPPSSLATANNSLTFFNCLSLVVSIQIGSGIFSAPAVISNHVPTPIAGILVWALAGILVWTGASCFIELGTTVPQNGGMQEYLRAGYGDFAGFLFSWIWLSIVRPCSIAIIAMIFAEHVNGIVLRALGVPGGWVANTGMALLGIWGITGVNCLGVKTGAKVAGWFLVLKLLLISSIIGAGVVVGIRENGGYLVGGVEEGRQARTIKYREDEKSGVWEVIGEYVIAVFAALWVYGGWDAVSAEYFHPPINLKVPSCAISR
jgi:solute carrier family 7 (L-type amino acid transporter), member 6